MSSGFDVSSLILPLDQVVENTLQSMCFAETAAAPEDAPLDPVLGAGVTFRGDASGRLELHLSSETAVELTSGFLGLGNEEVQAAQMEAVCQELTNIICGAMLSQAQPGHAFELDSPERTGITRDSLRMPVTRRYFANSGTFEVRLNIYHLDAPGNPA